MQKNWSSNCYTRCTGINARIQQTWNKEDIKPPKKQNNYLAAATNEKEKKKIINPRKRTQTNVIKEVQRDKYNTNKK